MIAKYIVHCFNSPQYLEVVDKLSTGSTKQSRNRFAQNKFLNMKINVPDSSKLKEIVDLLDYSVQLRFQQEEFAELLKKCQEGISNMISNSI